MTTPISLIDALTHRDLFGALPHLSRLDTWQAWMTFIKAVYGLPMQAEDLARFQQQTGQHVPKPGGYPESVCIVGCQSGKSQVAALVGVYEAIRAIMTKQRGVYVPILAQDLRGAQRALFGYVREAVQASPVLRHEVVRETADTIELTGEVTLAVYPCRPAAIRGIRAACVIVDELAFFISTDGRPTDTEMLRAARSRVATTGGKVLIFSSPYGQTGELWNLHRKHYGREETTTLVWQASAPQMNPTLPADYLARMALDDPEAYQSEVLGQFRAGVATVFEDESLHACVEGGIRERAWQQGRAYYGFCDPASGSGKDAFTFAIAHHHEEAAVLDVVRVWRPPFNPSGVIVELASLCRTWGITRVGGDSYAPGFVAEQFRINGLTYEPSAFTRSDLYLSLLPLVNAGCVRLLDHPELLRELRGLERRQGLGGRDRVDHRPGAHDDMANAAAGALVNVTSVRPGPRIRVL